MDDNNNDELNLSQDDLNPRPNQRQRTIMQPYDPLLNDHILFRNRLFEEISISVLEGEDAISQRLNFKYIDLLILRVITSSQLTANVYSRKNGYNNQNQMKFSRLILCKIVSSNIEDENNRVVYLMEARNHNKNLWNKNVNYRDNGTI